MIHEIIGFVEYLEKNDVKNNTNVFSEGIKLKEGMYIFLEKEGDELVIGETLSVDKKTERSWLYDQFLIYTTNTEMLNAMKSFNSGPKIYIAIGSPFGISISGLGLEKSLEKRLNAAEAYFKAAKKYIDEKNEQHNRWMKQLEGFVNTKMFEFIESTEKYNNLKKGDLFFFFLKEPKLGDYQEIQSRFLSEKLFNKDKFNIKTEGGEVFGISDNLSGFNDSKEFLKHKTAPQELNYRISGNDAMKLYKFFRLQQKNKILPNPMPLFIDEKELTEKAIKFYKNDRKAGHKEIIEHLLENRGKDLQNYYLIFFHNGQKGSRIIDLDFVPVFRYETDDMPKIRAVFKVTSKKDGELLRDFSVKNIFHFQAVILNKIFNNQLVTETKNGLWLKYFDDMDVKPEYGATDSIVDLFYKYRKAFYDYVYKSKRQAITFSMFDDMIRNSILDDIRHDKDHDKTFRIKEKLNIWFSLYNYFNNNKKSVDMINKTEQLFDRLKIIAKPENNAERITTNEEFAFASGQLIRTILNKSEAGERTHALLEPFLQKTNAEQFKLAIAREFEKYKHAFKFYKGDSNRYEFDKIMSEVMGFETSINMKILLPLILAGYFSETIFKKETENNNE